MREAVELAVPAERAELAVEVPEGWQLLPAGKRRRLRVEARRLDDGASPAFRVSEFDRLGEFTCVPAYELKVLGEVRLVHDAAGWWCGKQGTAYVETEAAVLVRVLKAA